MILKRIMDLIISFIMLLIIFPLLLVLSIYIKIVSSGPVLFIQERVGQGEKLFKIYKFRTMNGSPSPLSKLKWTPDDENRIIFGGKIIRDYGLDELPQLINILKGEMSIVGPRPLLPESVEKLRKDQKVIFKMKPGVLSLAVLYGRRAISFQEKIFYQVEYVKNWDILLDLKIIFKSAIIVMGRKNAIDK